MCDELPDVTKALEDKIHDVKSDLLDVLKRNQEALGARINDAKDSVSKVFEEMRSLLSLREAELMEELSSAYSECDKSDVIVSVEASHAAEDVLEDLKRI